MQFQGRIYKIFPVQSGTSQRGEWTKQDFIFEYFETPTDRYADRVLLSVMNDRIREYDLHEGDEVIIGFGHNTREYQGRYFNDVRLYHFEKVVRNGQGQQPAAQPQPTVAQASPTTLNAPASAYPQSRVAQPQEGQLFEQPQPSQTGDGELPF